MKIEIEIVNNSTFYKGCWVNLFSYECYIASENKNRRFKSIEELIRFIDNLRRTNAN